MGQHPDKAISQSQFLKYAKDLAEVYGLEKKRRRELQEAHEGLLALVDAMHDGAMVTDADLRIQAANSALYDILVPSDGILLGRTLAEVLPDPTIIDPLISHYSGTGDPPPSALDFTASSRKIYRCTATLLKNGWRFILLHNITAHIRAENLKSDFLAMISHELRTPLTGILGFAAFLKDDPAIADPQTLESISFIQESGARMLNTVEALLHFAALQSERLEMKNEPLQLALLANAAIEGAQHLAKEHNIALHLVHEPTSPVIVFGNAAMLRDLFRQLIQNGILFGQSGGSVAVHISRKDNQAVVTIEDNGIGIPADSLAKVFDSFYQEEECLNRNRDGLGLGLSLARLIVESHGGSITLSSTLGKGTTCHITLPERTAEPSQKHSSQ